MDAKARFICLILRARRRNRASLAVWTHTKRLLVCGTSTVGIKKDDKDKENIGCTQYYEID
ncbi:hypothetical protein HW555_013593 [Spodoptera exigua]|uniref:Uncharacterized protein n=1 Tax=Spodoptera exigua TaxID=7107 RepID=A0A835G171_SPOEX|nr:hypothetical protein HW555_013593 [Spodoptera exigua]